MPTFPGSSEFLGPLFHVKDLHQRSQELKGCREVVVIGGNKSAWDVCYSVASSGARAHMVIRRSGGSPSRVWRPICLLGIKLTLARLSSTRLFTWFDPSPFGSSFSSIRRFLQETILGVWLSLAFWAVLDFLAAAATGYSDLRLEMLRPWTSIFWMGNSPGIHSYETDWFEFVRNGRIVVHYADVLSLGETAVKLSDSSSLKADATVCCTGWKCTPPINFKPEGLSQEMGPPREAEFCKPDLIKGSRDDSHPFRYETINIPLLLDSKEAPYNLYRFLVPQSPRFLKQRNIAFIGMHRSVHAMIVAQAQALWVTAFFENHLRKELDPETVYRSTISHAEYERLRRPRESGGSGASCSIVYLIRICSWRIWDCAR
ncbi:hypothetical protein F5Y01DRAFT_310498 [Xylaria sp. FL0043]|nr:hypothetical protein F5Y01DRAFT_310498 [Xylaria sp. FL0043]